MATTVYNSFKELSAEGNLDLGNANVWVALLDNTTTADTENDGKTYIGDLTTLGECDSTGYVRKALANTVVNKDDANDRAEFDADDVTWTTLNTCTNPLLGVLVYEDPDNDGDSADDASNPLVAFLEFASTRVPDGSDFTIQWDSEGILQLA